MLWNKTVSHDVEYDKEEQAATLKDPLLELRNSFKKKDGRIHLARDNGAEE